MKRINRGVVIIKPQEPYLDWINHEPTLTSPVAMEELERDCTAILVPELLSLEDMLDYLEPLKPLLFEMELESWRRDPDVWPAERTAELFDAWFRLEPHSMVWDAGGVPLEKEDAGEAVDFTGTWHVVSSPDLDDDYLFMETTPYVTLDQEGTEVSGDFHIGLLNGTLYGRLDGERVLLSFEAMDEMDLINGAGTISLQGEQLILKLMFHLGGEYTFGCVLAP